MSAPYVRRRSTSSPEGSKDARDRLLCASILDARAYSRRKSKTNKVHEHEKCGVFEGIRDLAPEETGENSGAVDPFPTNEEEAAVDRSEGGRGASHRVENAGKEKPSDGGESMPGASAETTTETANDTDSGANETDSGSGSVIRVDYGNSFVGIPLIAPTPSPVPSELQISRSRRKRRSGQSRAKRSAGGTSFDENLAIVPEGANAPSGSGSSSDNGSGGGCGGGEDALGGSGDDGSRGVDVPFVDNKAQCHLSIQKLKEMQLRLVPSSSEVADGLRADMILWAGDVIGLVTCMRKINLRNEAAMRRLRRERDAARREADERATIVEEREEEFRQERRGFANICRKNNREVKEWKHKAYKLKERCKMMERDTKGATDGGEGGGGEREARTCKSRQARSKEGEQASPASSANVSVPSASSDAPNGESRAGNGRGDRSSVVRPTLIRESGAFSSLCTGRGKEQEEEPRKEPRTSSAKVSVADASLKEKRDGCDPGGATGASKTCNGHRQEGEKSSLASPAKSLASSSFEEKQVRNDQGNERETGAIEVCEGRGREGEELCQASFDKASVENAPPDAPLEEKQVRFLASPSQSDAVAQDENACNVNIENRCGVSCDDATCFDEVSELGSVGAHTVLSEAIRNRTRIVEPAGKKKGGAKQLIDKTPDHVSCSAVKVAGCGIQEVNGEYLRFEVSDGIPSYCMIGRYNAKEALFTIARWEGEDDGMKKWHITAIVPDRSGDDRIAFYVAYANSHVTLPPTTDWIPVEEGRHFLPPGYQFRGTGRGSPYPGPAIIPKK